MQKEIVNCDLSGPLGSMQVQNEPDIRSVIIQLLEQLVLPASLHKKMLTIRQNLQETWNGDNWAKIQQDVLELVSDLRCGSQQDNSDFEQFLRQMSANLNELQHDLEKKQQLLTKASTCRHYLGQAVNEHVTSIRAALKKADKACHLPPAAHEQISLIDRKSVV